MRCSTSVDRPKRLDIPTEIPFCLSNIPLGQRQDKSSSVDSVLEMNDQLSYARDLREQLLEAVCERPDSDEPRLILADWYETQGDPRADLIRLQCAPTQTEESLAEIEALLKAHEARWREELPRLPGVVWGGFRRGFVEDAIITGIPALKTLPVAGYAPLNTLTLRWPRIEDAELLASIDGLEPIRSLKILRGDVPILEPACLARFSGLRSLEVTAAYGPELGRAVPTEPFRCLSHLSLDMTMGLAAQLLERPECSIAGTALRSLRLRREDGMPEEHLSSGRCAPRSAAGPACDRDPGVLRTIRQVVL